MTRTDPKVRERANELHESGMPFQMAMAVALGRVDLNTALERLARQSRVERMMEQHDLSRALATQVSLGHADLAVVLARRRMAEHRDSNRVRSCLDEACEAESPLALALHGKRRVVGRIVAVESYGVVVDAVDPKDNTPIGREEIHKLQLKYAYAPDDFKRVRKAVKIDKELASSPIGPIPRPQDRYSCSDRRLFRCMDEDELVQVTLLEGDVFRGQITWFGRYEFGLRLRGSDAEITVFRHALHDLTAG